MGSGTAGRALVAAHGQPPAGDWEMNNYKHVIVGAGIGGLSFAAELKRMGCNDFVILERQPDIPFNLYNGVHYLHGIDFVTPFPFNFVEVPSTEQIWNPKRDEFKDRASLPEMLEYSLKLMNIRHTSAIMHPGNRMWPTYLPESHDLNDLLRAYRDYIGFVHFQFNAPVAWINPEGRLLEAGTRTQYSYQHMVTTMPLDFLRELTPTLSPTLQGITFQKRAIHITNYITTGIVRNWRIQLYVADAQFPVYRITVLNGILSMESLQALSVEDEVIIRYHLQRYFEYELSSKSTYIWPTGRIWGITKEERRTITAELATAGIYPLGRFGQWDGKMNMDTTIQSAIQLAKEMA
jgi:hypothetical protein